MMFPFQFNQVAILADEAKTFWFPEAASTFAGEVDYFFNFITWLSIVLFVLMMGAMGYFMVIYRERPGYRGSTKALHNTWLEITWTVIPSFIVVYIFVRGAYGYLEMVHPPVADTVDIEVTAQKWSWSFKYPNGAEHPELHLPVNRPARMIMRSRDVLHALFIPAFRTKMDIVPGRVNYLWFEPTLPGKYDLFCAEYCGDDHSLMGTAKGYFTVVHSSQEEFEDWMEKANQPPEKPEEHGKWLYERRGCKGCHSIDGTKLVGPSFKDSWGQPVDLADNTKTVFDENYVQRSITQPQAQARKGFERASAMPSFQGRFKEKEMSAIIAFMKSIGPGQTGQTGQTEQAGQTGQTGQTEQK